MDQLLSHYFLGNVLFLRGDLEIRPPDREVVTFEYLVERLGDYLLNHGPSTTTTNNQDKVRRGKFMQQTTLLHEIKTPIGRIALIHTHKPK